MIRDILMFIFGFGGIGLLCYVRVHFTNRQQKSSEPLDYNEQEAKLRKIAIALIIIGVALALIPAKYSF